jgi:hypothetical protein
MTSDIILQIKHKYQKFKLKLKFQMRGSDSLFRICLLLSETGTMNFPNFNSRAIVFVFQYFKCGKMRAI